MKTKVFILFFLFLIGAFFWQGIYLPKNTEAQSRIFIIEKGQGLFQIAASLEGEGLIKNKIFFELYLAGLGRTRQLQAGKYLLAPSMNIPEISSQLLNGDNYKEKVTIIEGWTLRDIAWYLENKGMFQAEELFELVGFPMATEELSKNFTDGSSFLTDKPKDTGLEGYLFPDTYYLGGGADIEKLVEMMLTNFDDKLTAELREEITEQNKTIFEIVTMASLLEKEVRTLEDKKIVSGILWKRIANKMPLQSCASIVYITGQRTTKVSIKDTEIDSPYNTYKYLGLPLGPICNPGLESILAAIYPEDSPFWYHLSTLEGETIFSRNLEEHNIAKAKYLK